MVHQYKLNGYNIVLDSCSGSIHAVDEVAYDVIAMFESHTDEEIVAAAKAAHIHQMIESLPQGYDTIVTDSGNSISKGQKQLLTIARAMLMDSSMLILDEATSNVDTQTEQLIQDAMLELMRGRTCFVIAHRLSTITGADRIMVMDKARIVQIDTPEEIISHPADAYVEEFVVGNLHKKIASLSKYASAGGAQA